MHQLSRNYKSTTIIIIMIIIIIYYVFLSTENEWMGNV